MHRDGPFRLARAGRKGRGVFTARAVAAGDPLFPFEGPRLRREEVVDFARAIQVGADLYLGPSGRIDDYVNHSCDPNAGVRRRGETIELFALRDILAEEEITFDYSTTMLTDPTRFTCRCGSRLCRHEVTPFRELPETTRRRYLNRGWVPAFVREATAGR